MAFVRKFQSPVDDRVAYCSQSRKGCSLAVTLSYKGRAK